MTVIEHISDMQKLANTWRAQSKDIAFVPTMGFLHEGHLSLIKYAKEAADIVVMSIFVNPIQFGPNEDFDQYPRDWERDKDLAEQAGVDVIFYPSADEMYPEGCNTKVSVSGITDVLCGKDRPGHFQGVTTVVSKLFNIVKPTVSVFGQKDAQQAAIIQKMVKDMNMDIQILVAPIIREKDGLARSSRNVRLIPEDRKKAVILSQTLLHIKNSILSGDRNFKKLAEDGIKNIESRTSASVDYLEILSYPQLCPVSAEDKKILMAVAAKFGAVRLIDNVIMEE